MRLRTSLLSGAVCLLGLSPLLAAEQVAFDHSYSIYDQLLKSHVYLDGPRSSVNYRAIKADPSRLQQYLDSVQRINLPRYQKFTEPEKLAFLINAYNALTIKLIIDHYPVSSIKDIGGIFSSPWKQAFFELLGERQHLDFIEHELIRRNFAEPRIHFALVCAARGCPQLRNEAYLADRLDRQLEDAARIFLRDGERNRFEQGKLYLSRIFDWYGADFEKSGGTIRNFVAPRMAMNEQAELAIRESQAGIVFLPYDWSLNDYLRVRK